MNSEATPEPEKPKPGLGNLLVSLKKLLTAVKQILTPFARVPSALARLPIPKKLVIPAIAAAVLLAAGAATFGVVHARLKQVTAPAAKAAASTPVAATVGPAAACSGVVRDIYRQTVAEDPSVTLADVRSEVLSSGVSCAPDPEITAELKDLSPACRDMVQYTFLGVRDGHADITVNDVREKVVEKSVACERDRASHIVSVTRHKIK